MKRLLALVTLLTAVGCGEGEVQIRFRNDSDQTFDSLEVGFGRRLSFLGLAPGASTEYYQFDHAYHYGYVRVVISGEEYIIQPIDYVGEQELEPGDYTHALTIVGPPGHGGVEGFTTRDK